VFTFLITEKLFKKPLDLDLISKIEKLEEENRRAFEKNERLTLELDQKNKKV